jgi:hypothetical protein
VSAKQYSDCSHVISSAISIDAVVAETAGMDDDDDNDAAWG